MGSTLSAPWAYLQKHGWPWMGIPASLEILRNWSVKPLHKELGKENKTIITNNKLYKSVHVLIWASINKNDLHNAKYYIIYNLKTLWVILEDFFPTLPLCGKAGNGPHLDLHPSVELFPPHVPHPVARCGHGAVLKQHCSHTTSTLNYASTFIH